MKRWYEQAERGQRSNRAVTVFGLPPRIDSPAILVDIVMDGR